MVLFPHDLQRKDLVRCILMDKSVGQGPCIDLFTFYLHHTFFAFRTFFFATSESMSGYDVQFYFMSIKSNDPSLTNLRFIQRSYSPYFRGLCNKVISGS